MKVKRGLYGRWQAGLAVLVLLIAAGCGPVSRCGDLGVAPCTYYSPQDHFVQQVGEMVVQVNAINAAPVKLSLNVSAEILADITAAINPSIVEFTSNPPDLIANPPDIIVTDVVGSWDLSTSATSVTPGYTPAIIRNYVIGDGTVDYTNVATGTRHIELNNNLSAALPDYFAPTITSPATSTRVVVLGHYRTIVNRSDRRPRYLPIIADAINAMEPDYVYMMGDMVYAGGDSWAYVKLKVFTDLLTAPSIQAIVFVPGNHEYDKNGIDETNAFINEELGGPHEMIETDTVNLVSLDSNLSIGNALQSLSDSFSIIDAQASAKPAVLMVHHAVWRERGSGSWMKYPNQSFAGEDIMPALEGNIGAIFVGNATGDVQKIDLALSETITGYKVGISTGSINPSSTSTATPIYFGLLTVGADQILRLNPVYVDLKEGAEFYGFGPNPHAVLPAVTPSPEPAP